MEKFVYGTGLFNNLLEGMGFMVLAVFTLFATVQIMMEIREEERRKGIDMKC
jgi:hypothetical protein